jgi:hypothetical protein
MRLRNTIGRVFPFVPNALTVICLVAVLTSLSAISAKAELAKCQDTACWPNYEYICQHISYACHCTRLNGTYCE